MMARHVVAFVVFAASPAIAGHRRCHEASAVVGYQRCSRLGAGWSGPTLAWELGGAMLRVPLDAIDRRVDVTSDGATSAYHVVSPTESGAAAAARLRNLYGLTEHMYLASELTLGRLKAPSLAIQPVAREVMSLDDTTTGWLFAGMLAVGARSSIGPVVLGTELAFGPRLVTFSNDRLPGVLFGQGGPVLEARAHASAWLSMHWTTSVMLATSLFARNDVSITFAIGLHAFPYDGGR